uniref:Amino acid transporter transmembrane domain-containing protein n=2 Tax=Cuerna arida TaxID=1464854 RepID=A0A1B6GKP3_9HEMI
MAEKKHLEKEKDTIASNNTKSKFGIDEEPYKPWEHREQAHPLSTAGALFHMIKSSLGSGILAMPVAFKDGGLWTSLVGAIFVGFVYAHCVSILVFSCQTLCVRLRKPRLEFSEIAGSAFRTGPPRLQPYSTFAKGVVDASLFFGWYSTCMVYVVFIGSSLQQVIEYDSGLRLDIRYYIMLAAIFVIPIGLIRNLKFLVPFSFLAICALTFSCGYVYVEIFQDLPPISSRPAFKGFQTLPLFFTTVIFAYDGIGMVLPIENSMKNPRRFLGCPGVLNISVIWLVSMYAGMGFFGYLRYGDATQGTITLNISTSSIVGQAVKLMVTFNVVCSYALFLYVPVEIAWRILKPKLKSSIYCYCIRLIMILISIVIAVLVPDLEPFVGLVGAGSSSTLNLFFPPVIELVTFWEDKAYMGRFHWRAIKNVLIILLWLVCLTTGIYSSLVEIVKLYA